MSRGRAHLIISGRVQGVFFRAETKRKADELGLTGWVRNNPDGTVEAVAEGELDMLERFIEWCHEGPSRASVSGVEVRREPYTGKYDAFAIN